MHKTNCRSGFTLVELLLGVAMLAMVLAAVTTLTFAVSSQWKADASAQSRAVSGSQTVSRVASLLRESKFTGTVIRGSLDNSSANVASVIFWNQDTNGDNTIQIGEISVLEYDPTRHRLVVYSVNWPVGWTSTQISSANASLDATDLQTSNAAANFKSLSVISARTLATDVMGAEFIVRAAASTTQRPVFDCLVRLGNETESTTQYTSVALRPPLRSPTPVGASDGSLLTQLIDSVNRTVTNVTSN